jgi:acetylornithine/N-succinyldiaminopimelate aminotransferase
MEFHDAKKIEKECFLDLYSQIRSPMVMARGEGAYLWDTEGKRYLDFISGGRAVGALGHCHPKVVAALTKQASTLIHVSNDFYSEPQLQLARLLHELTGGGRVFFCNSGAEANEAAIKLARKHAHQIGGIDKFEIITALDSFHGYVAYNDTAALEQAVSDKTCAVMLEPVLGESGVYPASKEYLQAARRLCDEHKAALVLDEVQTGLGRTGSMFAYEQYGIRPDILTLSKALGAGAPIGATVAWEPIASTFAPGDHATTFGGSPLVAAAALAAVTALRDDHLVENARLVGGYLAQKLTDLKSTHPLITEVRGRGLMIGVSLAQPKAGDIKAMCRDLGLLIITVGDSILRLLPPLVLLKEQADDGLRVLETALARVGS